MADRHSRGRTVTTTILLGGLVVLLGLIVAFLLVVVVAVAASDAATSGGFSWASAIVGVSVLAVCGFCAGRIAKPRLRRAGLGQGAVPYAVAAVGPALVAAAWFALAGLGGPVISALVPAFVAAAGSVAGVRLRG